MIPYGRHHISDADVAAVVDVLRSDFLTQGPAVPQFESAVAKGCGAEYAVAVNSATSALHVACLALGVKPGDRVWTSPITFVASANCALYCGATVDFVDVDPRTGNMSPQCLATKLQEAEREGTLPKVVIPVHLCGQPCEMGLIAGLARKYGFSVIEDASHAIGAKYRGEPVGNCRYSDVTVFSFHPVKIVTTGEGGMAVTRDPKLARSMQLLRSHGITRESGEMTHSPDGSWYYQQIALGYNYRMTDLQAALGASQLKRLGAVVEQRHKIASSYDRMLEPLPVAPLWQHPDTFSAYHLYVIRLVPSVSRRSHREVFEAMRAKGIGVNLHYIPVHCQPYYRSLGFKIGQFPIAEQYYQEAITIPIYPTLTSDERRLVVDSLAACLNE